jgi:hypothetical protein
MVSEVANLIAEKEGGGRGVGETPAKRVRVDDAAGVVVRLDTTTRVQLQC